jgi:predicted nucleic acid-binding protein
MGTGGGSKTAKSRNGGIVMRKLLFDNNVFDNILEHGEVFDSLRSKYEYFTCATAVEELAKIPDSKMESRIKLLLSFAKLEVKFLADSVGFWDMSRFDMIDWATDEASRICELLLNSNKTNKRDAIIGTTAVVRNCTLLTTDKDLITKMNSNNFSVMSYDEFKEGSLYEQR